MAINNGNHSSHFFLYTSEKIKKIIIGTQIIDPENNHITQSVK